MLVTNGYGFTVEHINKSCPADLAPYEKAYNMHTKQQDTLNWMLGIYVKSAVTVAVEQNLYGKKANSEYIEQPILEKAKQSGDEFTEEELNLQREAFMMQLLVMQDNYNLTHSKEE